MFLTLHRALSREKIISDAHGIRIQRRGKIISNIFYPDPFPSRVAPSNLKEINELGRLPLSLMCEIIRSDVKVKDEYE